MSTAPQPTGNDEVVDLHAVKEAYVEAILTPDARRARKLVADACDTGVPVAAIYLQVVQPALHDIGRMWQEAQIGVANEHLATQITAAVMAELSGRIAPDGPAVGSGRRAVVSCSPGEMHVLGGQMVSDFLEADGWEVLPLGADTPAEELARLADEERVDLVALSTALPVHLLAAGTACAALRRLEQPPFIVAGGQAFGGSEERARAVGADAFAPDPETLMQLLAERFGDR